MNRFVFLLLGIIFYANVVYSQDANINRYSLETENLFENSFPSENQATSDQFNNSEQAAPVNTVSHRKKLKEKTKNWDHFQVTGGNAVPTLQDHSPLEDLSLFHFLQFSDGEAPDTYQVEPGDTLFDICDQLLGDGSYWPNLWALNPGIKNPHFIWPGMILRFYPGDSEKPPSLSINKADEMIPTHSIDLDSMIDSKPLEITSNALKPLKTSVISRNDIDSLDKDIYYVGKVYNSSHVKVTLPGLLVEKEFDSACSVLIGTKNQMIIKNGEELICQSESPLTVNQLYTVLRFTNKIHDPYEKKEFYQYKVIAMVRAKENLEEKSVFLASVEKQRLEIISGDILIDPIQWEHNLNLTKEIGSKGSEQSRIISFGDLSSEMTGSGRFLYLNKGSNNNYQPGQVLQIHQFLHELVESSFFTNYPKKAKYIGNVRILHTTPSASLAYVLDARSELYVGDSVGL